jgi:hypothetical protein
VKIYAAMAETARTQILWSINPSSNFWIPVIGNAGRKLNAAKCSPAMKRSSISILAV